ncbi:MAG TPA: GMC family oxidoreductase [Gemmatimonadales bacterium]|nr:GMC family oxidoreductase [Gemmatimonadales bacterium]
MIAAGWNADSEAYDAIVIGSGFGGAMAVHVLVEAGWSVLMLERGDWVPRGARNWSVEGVGPLTPHYSTESPYRLRDDAGDTTAGAFHCVGGPSVFYGGVAFRFRAEDLEHDPEIAGNSGARWPFTYAALEPYYAEAERILGVAGEAGADPTEPGRSTPYSQPPMELAPISQRIERAARELGCRPFRLPLAINHTERPGRNACVACGTCDGFACAVGAKNDLATVAVQPLLCRGLHLRTNAVATRLTTEGGRVTAVEATDRDSGRVSVYRGGTVVLAAGAIASPHLLLASGLQRLNPGGHVVGRYLMRHYNEIVFGVSGASAAAPPPWRSPGTLGESPDRAAGNRGRSAAVREPSWARWPCHRSIRPAAPAREPPLQCSRPRGRQGAGEPRPGHPPPDRRFRGLDNLYVMDGSPGLPRACCWSPWLPPGTPSPRRRPTRPSSSHRSLGGSSPACRSGFPRCGGAGSDSFRSTWRSGWSSWPRLPERPMAESLPHRRFRNRTLTAVHA